MNINFMSTLSVMGILLMSSIFVRIISKNSIPVENTTFTIHAPELNLYPKKRSSDSIKTIQSFHEVDFATIAPDSLIVFDVDDTLIQPVDTILINASSPDAEKLWQWIVKAHPNIKDWSPFSAILDHWHTYEAKHPLIEPCIIHEIEELKERGIPVIACTFMETGLKGNMKENMEEWRYNHLRSLGFNGSYNNLILTLTVSEDTNPIFYRGILVTDKAPKGLSLGAFLDATNLHPKTIIMFDDRYNFLTSVQEECMFRGITFQGYKYKGAKKKVWDKELVKFQAHYFVEHKKWLSDEEAYAKIAIIKSKWTHTVAEYR